MNEASINTCYADLWDERTGERSISIHPVGNGENVRLAIKNRKDEVVATIDMTISSAITLIQILKFECSEIFDQQDVLKRRLSEV